MSQSLSTELIKNQISGDLVDSCLESVYSYLRHQFSSVQLLSRLQLFVTPWIGAHQASLSITNSRSLLKPMSIESVMPSSHLFLCRPLLLLPPIPPSIRVFSNESTLQWGGQSIGVSASASVLPMNTQDWSPLGWTGWISLQSKGLSRVFSNTTVQKHQSSGAQLSSQSNSHIRLTYWLCLYPTQKLWFTKKLGALAALCRHSDRNKKWRLTVVLEEN